MAETDSAPSTGSTPPIDEAEVIPSTPVLSADEAPAKLAGAKQDVVSGVASFQQQAVDKVRLFAEDGKAKAGGALDDFAQILLDAAGQVDDKLGTQYGDHARTAATTVQKFADSVRDKDVDELADDVRGYIRKSPAAAVGVTAALGFALARMVHAGLDQRS